MQTHSPGRRRRQRESGSLGDTVTFDMSAIHPSHPLEIRVSLGGTLASGVTGAGTETVVWDTTGLPAGTYYYQCTVHPNMYGTDLQY